MNWIFEPRSKDYNYDDDQEGNYTPSTLSWYEYLLMPLVILPFMFLFAVFEILVFFYILLNDFYETAKRTYESGKLEFPGLIYAGIVVVIILVALHKNNLFDVTRHPFITFCSSIFIFLFTLAPLTGLTLRFFKQDDPSPEIDNNQGV